MLSAHLSAFIPLNAVQNPEYRRFLRSISQGNFEIPSRSKMCRLLASEYKLAIIAIKDWFPKDS